MRSDSKSLEEGGRIDLARAAPFRLGDVEVRPALRQLVRGADGSEEVVEPRIMQVLVALAEADGAIVTRDDLVRRCWEGRIVGEDAINRCISRVRRLAETIGRDAFRIETLNKVGYRLLRTEPPSGTDLPLPPPSSDVPARLGRRRVLAMGGGVAALALAGSAAWWWRDRAERPPESPTPEIAALMNQAHVLLGQRDAQGISQANGLFRQVTRLAPDYAEGWGALALTYAATAGAGPPEQATANAARATAAAERATALDPDEPYAAIARIALLPRRGTWWQVEQVLRAVRQRRPDVNPATAQLAVILGNVGRFRETVPLWEDLARRGPPLPGNLYAHGQALWAANRLEEAEAELLQAMSLFPLHFAIWFTWAYFLLYTGRARQALEFVEERANRPPGYEDENFEVVAVVARAMMTRSAADVARAVSVNMDAAHRGTGFAENTIQFMSALGRLDEAFAVADAYFFDRGWAIPDLRFTVQQASHTRLADRRTHMLFLPSVAPMRRDPRFARLVEEVGLERYWRESGSVPDYRRS